MRISSKYECSPLLSPSTLAPRHCILMHACFFVLFVLPWLPRYVRLLGAFYLRLIGTPKEIYEYLEPLYHDFRKVRQINPDGTYSLLHMDEVSATMTSQYSQSAFFFFSFFYFILFS